LRKATVRTKKKNATLYIATANHHTGNSEFKCDLALSLKL
jgi:hypothetical protein